MVDPTPKEVANVEDDPELAAMATVKSALEPLEPDTRSRVVEWAIKRYSLNLTAGTRSGPSAGHGGGAREQREQDGSGSRPVAEYQHFADLYDVVDPKTDVDRALTGGYWFQFVLGNESFGAQQVNDELKNVGTPVANIARALTNLQGKAPALVRQLSKSGRSQQARKTYKLTVAGQRWVEQRINGGGANDDDGDS
jgi:hypothetical protein